MLTRRSLLKAAGASAAMLPFTTISVAAELAPRTLPLAPILPSTLLLIDDHHILYRPGTKRVSNPLTRHPKNPLIPGKEKPWELDLAWSSVYRNPTTGNYQIWYQAFAGDHAKDKTRRCTVAYAESTDGISWTKPNLGLFPFDDIKETNIVLIANGGHSDRYGVSVVVEPHDPDASRRYKMCYFDFSKNTKGEEFPGLSVAFSPDGIHWTKHPQAPLLPCSYGDYGATVPFQNDPARKWDHPLSVADAMDVIYDPLAQAYAIYGKMWIDGPDGKMYWKHAACRTQSKDFIHWDAPELIMSPDEFDPPYVEFHTTPVFYYQGVYFAAPQILNRKERGGVMDIELAISRDGKNFQRPFRKPFWLPRAPGNVFDSGSLFTNCSPVVLENEIRIYYGGYSQGATGANDYELITGIGLATLPLDRFASVEPIDEIAQITLRPLDLSKLKSLTLNADASKGSIHPELLDASGYRIRNFTREDVTPITTDSLRHKIEWKSPSLGQLPPANYILRLHLKSSKVYALNV